MALMLSKKKSDSLKNFTNKGFSNVQGGNANPTAVSIPANGVLSVAPGNIYCIYLYGTNYSQVSLSNGTNIDVMYDDDTFANGYGTTLSFNNKKPIMARLNYNSTGNGTATFT